MQKASYNAHHAQAYVYVCAPCSSCVICTMLKPSSKAHLIMPCLSLLPVFFVLLIQAFLQFSPLIVFCVLSCRRVH